MHASLDGWKAKVDCRKFQLKTSFTFSKPFTWLGRRHKFPSFCLSDLRRTPVSDRFCSLWRFSIGFDGQKPQEIIPFDQRGKIQVAISFIQCLIFFRGKLVQIANPTHIPFSFLLGKHWKVFNAVKLIPLLGAEWKADPKIYHQPALQYWVNTKVFLPNKKSFLPKNILLIDKRPLSHTTVSPG